MGAAGLGLLAGCGRLPWQAQAPPRVARVGVLSGGSAEASTLEMAVFRQGLRDQGWVEGENSIWNPASVQVAPTARRILRPNWSASRGRAPPSGTPRLRRPSKPPRRSHRLDQWPARRAAASSTASRARGEYHGAHHAPGRAEWQTAAVTQRCRPRRSPGWPRLRTARVQWRPCTGESLRRPRTLGVQVQRVDAREPEEFDPP